MLVVTALGGNALLRRGEAMTAENQRRNVRIAAEALAPWRQKSIAPPTEDEMPRHCPAVQALLTPRA